MLVVGPALGCDLVGVDELEVGDWFKHMVVKRGFAGPVWAGNDV